MLTFHFQFTDQATGNYSRIRQIARWVLFIYKFTFPAMHHSYFFFNSNHRCETSQSMKLFFNILMQLTEPYIVIFVVKSLSTTPLNGCYW